MFKFYVDLSTNHAQFQYLEPTSEQSFEIIQYLEMQLYGIFFVVTRP